MMRDDTKACHTPGGCLSMLLEHSKERCRNINWTSSFRHLSRKYTRSLVLISSLCVREYNIPRKIMSRCSGNSIWHHLSCCCIYMPCHHCCLVYTCHSITGRLPLRLRDSALHLQKVGLKTNFGLSCWHCKPI